MKKILLFIILLIMPIFVNAQNIIHSIDIDVYINEDDYQTLYGIPYKGQFDNMKPASLYSKKGKKHVSGKHKDR